MFIVLKGTDGREMQVNTRHVTKVMPIGKSNLTWVFLSDGTKEKSSMQITDPGLNSGYSP